MLKAIILVSLSSFFICQCKRRSSLEYIPVDFLERNDTLLSKEGHRTYYHYEFFIVRNFEENSVAEQQIDSFVNTIFRKFKKPLHSTTLEIYKESNLTNLRNLKSNPRDIDRYSNKKDQIYKYDQTFNGDVFKYKIKEGKIIFPRTGKKIIIESI